MSKSVKVSLTSPKSKKALSLDDKFISLGKGECIFPFNYKDKKYNKCYPGKKGDWCATEVYSSGNMKKYAYCVSPSKSKKNNAPTFTPKDKGKSKKNNAATSTATSTSTTKPKSKKNNSDNGKGSGKSSKLKFKIQTKFNSKSIDKRFLIPEQKTISPKVWELPNRKTFPKWFNKEFKPYMSKKDSMKSGSLGGFDFFNHQKIVRDYLNINSPYRGVLLYHGLGVGKTCASIAISEGFRTNREIIILLNKSLVTNFRVNLMKCGFDMFRIKQHWVFHDFSDPKDPMKSYAKYLKIPNSVTTKQAGAWFIDFTKKPNYDSLTGREQKSLNNQIEAMIDSKYSFVHIDGLNKNQLDSMIKSKKFDNKLLIVDEVHNITNAMSKPFPGIRGKGLKQLIMEAENLRAVFLSGTPMINNLFETAQLFNLLRGHIHNFQYTLLRKSSTKISFDEMVSILNEHNLVDQVIPKKSDKIINIVRNPRGFVTAPSKNGVIASPENDMSDDEFKEIIKKLFRENNYDVSLNVNKYTALPDNEDEFMGLFYNEAKNQIKNPMLFQSRIMGLVSYFSTQDKSLLPTVTVNEVVPVPMSKYQFLAYSEIRKEEIDQDKSKKQTVKPKSKGKGLIKRTDSTRSNAGSADDNLFDDKKSSYRAYSRMHCSFVFPESIKRPYPNQLHSENIEDVVEAEETIESNTVSVKKSDITTKNGMFFLNKNMDRFLDPQHSLTQETTDAMLSNQLFSFYDSFECANHFKKSKTPEKYEDCIKELDRQILDKRSRINLKYPKKSCGVIYQNKVGITHLVINDQILTSVEALKNPILKKIGEKKPFMVFNKVIKLDEPISIDELKWNETGGIKITSTIDLLTDRQTEFVVELLKDHGIPIVFEPNTKGILDYDKAKEKALKELYAAKDTLLKIDDPEQLMKYSPKYNIIIKKCNEINGLSFIYTEYKTLEGIATLEICLEANGYAPFRLKEVSKGKYSIDISAANKDKPKFAFWGGNQDQSDIIRKIYNNQFEELPVNIKEQLEEMYPSKNNIRGDIIKILLTTKSGAEGIDLQNVRQVHIVEPYWNPVRTKQVKGRAVRVGSHLQLPAKDRTVEIYSYLATIKIEHLKSDLTILDDKGGMTSDEVLHEISLKKLGVMNDFLRLIKETSFDCNINLNETRSKDNYFECLSFGTASRDNYSFIPNVKKEHVDTERRRRVDVTAKEYVFKKIKMKGKFITFAVLMADTPDGPNILYDAEMAKVGDAGEPLGEYVGEASKLKPYDVKRLKEYIKSF